MDLGRAFDRLLGNTDAMEDAESRAESATAPNGAAAPTPTVTRDEDGTLVIRAPAPDLLEDSIRVEHKGEGHFLVTANSRPALDHRLLTKDTFSFDLNLPAEADGVPALTYRDGVLEIRIAPS
jgi:HSP20 family molecular chaperone IbpA